MQWVPSKVWAGGLESAPRRFAIRPEFVMLPGGRPDEVVPTPTGRVVLEDCLRVVLGADGWGPAEEDFDTAEQARAFAEGLPPLAGPEVVGG